MSSDVNKIVMMIFAIIGVLRSAKKERKRPMCIVVVIVCLSDEPVCALLMALLGM